jgi:DNA-binding CsgD family transcriptional regulator
MVHMPRSSLAIYLFCDTPDLNSIEPTVADSSDLAGKSLLPGAFSITPHPAHRMLRNDVYGESSMCSTAAYVPYDSGSRTNWSQIVDAIRSITKLTEGVDCDYGSASDQDDSEVIVVDAEVDGARYLLVRMPRLSRNRVQLSPREQEIGRMVAKGHPNKVIADVLNISSWTVCTHLRRIFAKLGVGSRAAMVAQLIELGVLAPDRKSSLHLR